VIHDEHGPLDIIFRDMRKARIREFGPPSFRGHEVLEEIGEGGFALVYRAREEKLEREVALKVLLPLPGRDESAEERFLNEARALARVRHPNVLTLYGILEQDGAKALSTELVRGRSLDRVVHEDGPLAPGEAARIGTDVAWALEAVHAAGIVHRDVKSTNVILEDGGRTVLADFGLGVFLCRPGPGGAGRSAAGAPLFMSPEQARGGPVDPRTDIYSLGVLCYHLLTGDFPYRADDLETLFSRIEEGKATPLEEARPGVPPALSATVMKAIRPAPADRFQSAREMAEALAPLAGESGAPGNGASGARSGRRRVTLMAAAAVAGAVLLGLLVLAFLGAGPGPGEPFEFDAALEVTRGQETGKSRTPAGGERLSLDVSSRRDLWVYVVREDRRARKFLLFPTGQKRSTNPLAGGERHVLPRGGPRARGWAIEADEPGEAIVVIVSATAIGPLEDSVPLSGSSKETGKDGAPRLKPVALRGLHRTLAGILGAALAAPVDDDEEMWMLSESIPGRLVPGRRESFTAEGAWVGRVEVPPGDG
jgi:hypothetical protein